MALPSLLAALLLAAPAHATKPCGPDTWYGSQNGPAPDWKKLSQWILLARVSARKENIVPAVNCYLKDKSGCATEDKSTVKLKTVMWEKGGPAKSKWFGPAYCAPAAPKETGKLFRFYGVGDAFLYYEKVSR